MEAIKKEPKKTITAKVAPGVERKLKQMAKKKDRGVSWVVNQILTNYFIESSK